MTAVSGIHLWASGARRVELKVVHLWGELLTRQAVPEDPQRTARRQTLHDV
ncbi:hypothetical protein GCM10027404_22330 [Arthrobacter tumbae]